jgi:hypothetical protein
MHCCEQEKGQWTYQHIDQRWSRFRSKDQQQECHQWWWERNKWTHKR